MAKKKQPRESSEPDSTGDQATGGSVFRAGRDIRAGGSIAGGDIAGRDIAGRDIHTRSGSTDLVVILAQWQKEVEEKIDAEPQIPAEEKKDLKEQIDKITKEASKGKKADWSRVEKFINTVAVIAPDIFEIVIASLVNPLAGIGVALKKIGDRAKLVAKPG